MGLVSEAAESIFPFTIFPNGSHHIKPCGTQFIICYRLSPLSPALLCALDHLQNVDIILTTSFSSYHAISIPDIISGSRDHVHTPHVNLDIYEKFKPIDLMLIEFIYSS